jgi:hypothetical protein
VGAKAAVVAANLQKKSLPFKTGRTVAQNIDGDVYSPFLYCLAEEPDMGHGWQQARNDITNELSAHSQHGYLAEEIGLEVTMKTFYYGLTLEKSDTGGITSEKLRVIFAGDHQNASIAC